MEKREESIIAQDVEIAGAIKSGGSVQFEGILDGELDCQGDVTIGTTAQIKGNLSANSVVVEGSIQGDITAADKIEMKSTATVVGDIQSKRLAVEDGVTFMGKSEVNPGSTSGVGAPASSAMAENFVPKEVALAEN